MDKITLANVNGIIADNIISKNKLNFGLSEGAQYKTGYGERTTGEGTGTEDFDCGFTPKLIVFIGINCDTRNSGTSYGFSDGTNNYCMDWASSAIGFIGVQTTNKIIIIRKYDTASTCTGSVSATSDTGFTINWSAVDVNGKYIWFAAS